MVGKGRLREVEMLQQLAGAELSFCKHLDNLQACFVSQGLEDGQGVGHMRHDSPRITAQAVCDME